MNPSDWNFRPLPTFFSGLLGWGTIVYPLETRLNAIDYVDFCIEVSHEPNSCKCTVLLGCMQQLYTVKNIKEDKTVTRCDYPK